MKDLYAQRRAGMLNAVNTAMQRYSRLRRYHSVMYTALTAIAMACFKAEQWCLDRSRKHRAWIGNP